MSVGWQKVIEFKTRGVVYPGPTYILVRNGSVIFEIDEEDYAYLRNEPQLDLFLRSLTRADLLTFLQQKGFSVAESVVLYDVLMKMPP